MAGRSWRDVKACLDLPCGYGRVTRHLARRLDPRRVTACDIDWQAARFCAAEFGVEPPRSQPDRRRVRITLHARDSLRRAMADRFGDTLSLIRFAERGWDAHQDVWSDQRAGMVEAGR